MAAAGGLALAAAHRVVDRVHRHAAVVRLASRASGCGPPCRSTRSRARGCRPGRSWRSSRRARLPHLARGQRTCAQSPSRAMSCAPAPARAHHLAALAVLQLDVVDHRAERDLRERQGVADVDVGALARRSTVAPTSGRPARGCSASRRRRSGAARCAPSGSGRTRSLATFAGMPCLSRLKSIIAVAALVAAAAPPGGELAPVVAAAASGVLPSVSAFCGRSVGHAPRTCRCVWKRLDALIGFLLLDRHLLTSPRRTRSASRLRPAAPRPSSSRPAADEAALAAHLAVHAGDPDLGDLDLEQLLDRPLDLDLVRVAVRPRRR